MSKWSNPPVAKPGEDLDFYHPVEAEAPAIAGDSLFIQAFHGEEIRRLRKAADEDSKKDLTVAKLITIGVFSVVLYGFALYGAYRAIFG